MFIGYSWSFFFFPAEDGIRDAQEARGLGDGYKGQIHVDHERPYMGPSGPIYGRSWSTWIWALMGSWALVGLFFLYIYIYIYKYIYIYILYTSDSANEKNT